MPFRKFLFPNDQGEQLAARLDLPESGQPRAYVLFAHCFTCTKNIKGAHFLAQALTEAGFGVVRFDFSGLGESEGDFANTNFSSNVADLVAVARGMEQELAGPSVLVGHSLGGAAVLMAAAQIPSARAIATVAAPCRPTHVLSHISTAVETIEREGKAKVFIAGRPFTIKKQFLDDLAAHHMDQVVSRLDCPLLVLHSPSDEIVGVENGEHLFAQASHPKAFVSLGDADHLLARREDARWAGSTIAAWASRFVPRFEPPPLAIVPEREATIVHIGREHYRSTILANTHRIIADEPLNLHGKDLGPNPYDLLLSSLGACTAMTVRMYADRKEWPVEAIRVRLTHEKTTEKNAEGKNQTIDHIVREIAFDGPLDEEQRARLMEIADKCPVHKTLHTDIDIQSRPWLADTTAEATATSTGNTP